MNALFSAPPRWSTSAYGTLAADSPTETSALGAHMQLCHALRGRLFALRCGAESVHGAVSGRFVTTLTVVAAVIGAASFFF